MPIQTPQWTEFLQCPICTNDFDEHSRQPISLGCGHTVCVSCLSKLPKTQCPFDQAIVETDISKLPYNYALLQLVGAEIPDDPLPDIASVQENGAQYQAAKRAIEELALFLQPVAGAANGIVSGNSNGCNGSLNGNGNNLLTRPMQRKLVTLVNCQLAEADGRTRAMRAARSLGERTVTELILLHQNQQQLSANLWAAVRNRGCQFLGPAMQEEALKLILLALEGGEALSRKVLVLFVVQKLESMFPQASKTSIGHVVQLLYRASCFKVGTVYLLAFFPFKIAYYSPDKMCPQAAAPGNFATFSQFFAAYSTLDFTWSPLAGKGTWCLLPTTPSRLLATAKHFDRAVSTCST